MDVIDKAIERIKDLNDKQTRSGMDLDEIRALRRFLARSKQDPRVSYYFKESVETNEAREFKRPKVAYRGRKMKTRKYVLKTMKSKYAGKCSCGKEIKKGDWIVYDAYFSQALCNLCGTKLKQGKTIPV